LGIIQNCLNFSTAQTTYTVVNGGTKDGYYQPIGALYGYQRYASIYTYAQLTAAGGDYGTITDLAFYCAIAGSASIPTKIYILQTSATTVSSDTWTNTISSATLVYSSTNAYNSSGVWVDFDITDFSYTADNIMILVESNYGGSGTNNRPYFYSIEQGSNMYWIKDGSAPIDNGTPDNYQAHLKLTFTDPPIWTSAVSSAWLTAGNWSSGVVPTSSDSPVIPNVATQPIITSTVTLAGLIIDASSDITISTNSLTVSGTIDLNGTMNIDNATVNSDGTFDATGGTIDMTNANASLILSSTVTSLGTLDAAMGTVTYDGGTQTVLADNYYNLSISTAGTKTASGNLNIDGDLVTAATATCKLDLSTYDLNVAGDITVGATNGLDVSDASSLVTIDGAVDQTITHAGATGGGAPVAETAESGLGGFATTGSTAFTTTTSYNNTGSKAYINSYGVSNTNYLTYNSNIDLSTATAATLTFYHIAKTEGTYDKCYVQYSQDGGSNWTTFPNSKYTGSYTDYSTKVYFHEDSYATWGTSTETPDDETWWKLETFDMTFLVAQDDIRIRFKLTSDGSAERYGWIIDDINITYLGGSGAEITEFTLNKASGNLVLASNLSIDGDLTFTSGNIDASSFSLTFLDAGTVSVPATDASHVIGTVIKSTASTTKFTFPIGDADSYEPIAITPSSSSATDWTVTFSNTAHADTDVDISGLHHVSEIDYWVLDRSGAANATVELTWDADDNVTAYTELRIGHYDGTTDWDMIVSTPVGTNASGVLTSDAAMSTFSPIVKATIGAANLGAADPLPISLVAFEGKIEDNGNKLRWTTASEKNNDYFTIEKTTDGKSFENIGKITGAGNSIYHNSYSLIDQNIEPIINYYRLKQTDYDGKHTYSDLISIDNRSEAQKEKKLVRITNTWGQEINESYKGVIIYIYSDGSIERKFNY